MSCTTDRKLWLLPVHFSTTSTTSVMTSITSTRRRGIKRSLDSGEAGEPQDGYTTRRVTIKLPTPTTVEECKRRLLSTSGINASFVTLHLVNRRGQIDPASLRNFIRQKNITLPPGEGKGDMFQTYLAAISFLRVFSLEN